MWSPLTGLACVSEVAYPLVGWMELLLVVDPTELLLKSLGWMTGLQGRVSGILNLLEMRLFSEVYSFQPLMARLV